jgi:hypothetical protein
MRKRTILALLVVLMTLAMMGLLVGCGDHGGESGGTGGSGDTDDIVAISTSSYAAAGGLIEITNYKVVFKQDPDEWIALSDEKKEELVRRGYDQALTRIATDGVSNYSITGMTSPTKVEEGDPDPNTAQLAFMLSLEEGTLNICAGVDGTQPIYTAHVPIEPSAS